MGFLDDVESKRLYEACEKLRECVRKRIMTMEDGEVGAHQMAILHLEKEAQEAWATELHCMLCDKNKEPYLDSPVG